MSWNELSVLAVIPARGGSKGIPRKNLRRVGPLSLIAWAAQTVGQLPWIDQALLSTDDSEMAEEGRNHGLEVPFIRPSDLSTDTAPAVKMWRHAWLESEKTFGQRYDLSVLLQPTTPLRQAIDVERTVAAMVDGGHDAAATVSPIPGHFSPQKTLTINDRGVLGFFDPDGAKYTSRQMLEGYYHRNGVCYAATRASVVDRSNIVEEDCVAVVISEYVINIDEPIELEIAAMFYAKADHDQPERSDEDFQKTIGP